MKKYTIDAFSFAISSKASFFIFLEIAFGTVFSLISLTLFADLMKDVLENDVIHFDTNVSNFFYSTRTPLLTNIMFGITALGSEILLIIASISFIFFAWKRHKQEAILFSVVLGVSAIVNFFVKQFVQRPRPEFAPLYLEHSFSFPSGHAMNSFVFYAMLAYFIFHFTRNNKLSSIIAALSVLLIVLIGISRIYLGVHYPTDVIGGYIAGFWVFITAVMMNRTIIFFKLFKESKKVVKV